MSVIWCFCCFARAALVFIKTHFFLDICLTNFKKIPIPFLCSLFFSPKMANTLYVLIRLCSYCFDFYTLFLKIYVLIKNDCNLVFLLFCPIRACMYQNPFFFCVYVFFTCARLNF